MSLIFSYSGFAPILRESIRNAIEENFEEEGRFGSGIMGGGNTHWEKSERAREQAGMTLQDTGQLAASIAVTVAGSGSLSINDAGGELFRISNNGEFDVELGSNKPYAPIHQYGGDVDIPVTEKSRKFFWYKFYKTKNPKWKAMALTNKSSFKFVMKRRPFFTINDDDFESIADEFAAWMTEELV